MRQSWLLFLVFSCPVLLRAEELPRTGREVKELASFDRRLTEFIRKYDLPGGTAAVAKDGRLVYARGFGWADRNSRTAMQPDALLRIASVSKPFTAAAILRLVEEGKLKLSDPILPHLKRFGADEEKKLDPRWQKVTIAHLLRHTAGFDRGKTFDPMFIRRRSKAPPGQPDIIRFVLGRPLDFDPGTKFVYSNFDYCILGRVIEELTGKGYEEAVRELVLRPAGITRMRLGKTRQRDRAVGEVVYYMRSGDKRCKSVFADEKELVEEPYGDFHLEALDSHGGWIGSAADLVRFASVLDGQGSPRLLKPESIEQLEGLSDPPVYAGKGSYYGLGWVIVVLPGEKKNWFHDGLLAGTRSLLIRTHDGLVMTALFNGQPDEKAGNFCREIDETLHKAAREVKEWPSRAMADQ